MFYYFKHTTIFFRFSETLATKINSYRHGKDEFGSGKETESVDLKPLIKDVESGANLGLQKVKLNGKEGLYTPLYVAIINDVDSLLIKTLAEHGLLKPVYPDLVSFMLIKSKNNLFREEYIYHLFDNNINEEYQVIDPTLYQGDSVVNDEKFTKAYGNYYLLADICFDGYQFGHNQSGERRGELYYIRIAEKIFANGFRGDYLSRVISLSDVIPGTNAEFLQKDYFSKYMSVADKIQWSNYTIALKAIESVDSNAVTTIEEFLKNGFYPDFAKGSKYYTLLKYACSFPPNENRLKIIKLLAQDGVEIDYEKDLNRPITLAIFNSNTDLVAFLLPKAKPVPGRVYVANSEHPAKYSGYSHESIYQLAYEPWVSQTIRDYIAESSGYKEGFAAYSLIVQKDKAKQLQDAEYERIKAETITVANRKIPTAYGSPFVFIYDNSEIANFTVVVVYGHDLRNNKIVLFGNLEYQSGGSEPDRYITTQGPPTRDSVTGNLHPGMETTRIVQGKTLPSKFIALHLGNWYGLEPKITW